MVTQLPSKFAAQAAAFEAYRQATLSDRHAHDLIVQFVDEGAINVGDIRPILKQWRTPSHPEFVEAGKTAWRLFNAVTETIKGDLWRLPARTTKFHAVFNREFFPNLSVASKSEVAPETTAIPLN